jgi:menaquinone-dependent protoporphyrinogen oxidase
MKILIIYGTTEGQSRNVATFLKTRFERHHHYVLLKDANDSPPSPAGFDAVLIGACIWRDIRSLSDIIFSSTTSH